jgi:hypothetical protein
MYECKFVKEESKLNDFSNHSYEDLQIEGVRPTYKTYNRF